MRGILARCLKIHFGKCKGEFLGSLSDGYLKWLVDKRRVSSVGLAEEVLRDRISLGSSACGKDGQEQRLVARGVASRYISDKDCTFARLKQEFDQDRLKETLNGLDRVDTQAKSATYASLLRQCGNAKAFSEGKHVHDHIIRSGYGGHRFLGNLLVQMYGNCGSMEDARLAFDKIRQPNAFSWNMLIGAYVRNGYLEHARSVFEKMPEQNVIAWNTMIAAYGQSGCLEDARSFFDKSPQRNVVSWNAMIAAYAQNGHGKEAIEFFRQMQSEGMNPNRFTFVSVLDACASSRAIEQGKRIHCSILKDGCDSDVVVGTALVNMYGKCGSLDDARDVFDKMPQRNVVSWSAMIAAYAQNGHSQKALELFNQMELEGMKPNKITFISILDACASHAAIVQGKGIHARIVTAGLTSDVILGNALVNMYVKCGNLDDARNVFDEMPQRNVVSWSAMIAAYAQNGNVEKALGLLHQMHLEGLKPNKITFISILDACASSSALAQGKEIHVIIFNSGFELDIVVGTALVSMYGRCQSLDDARRAFDKMPQRNVVSWTAMITAYIQNGHSKVAFELFQQMDLDGVKPDKITFISLLDACSSRAALKQGQVIHARINECGFESDVVVANALVNMYGKCGCLDNANIVFDKMPQRNVVSWTAMITAYAQNRHGKEALKLFQQMNLEGVKPNKTTFSSVLDACASLASLSHGKEIHAMICDDALESDVVVGTALVKMYGKCGSLNDARTVFEKIPQRNLVSWSVMIAACAQNGHVKQALDLFRRMCLEGVKPDKITFTSVLFACSHAGLLDDGCIFFISMSRDYGITPTVEHYGCMIDLVGRTGQLDEAEDLINNMPIEPDKVAWRTLLNICRMHGDVDRGAYAAEQFLELDPKKSASYVLLSNIYAAAGRWDDVINLRNTMKQRGIKKHAGHSCIENKDMAHQFIEGDTLHPQKEDIYSDLQK